MPERVQRIRKAGQPGMPPGAVYVGRGRGAVGRWGNPFKVGETIDIAYGGGEVIDRCDAVALYRVHLRRHPEIVEAARRELAGRDLACWCPLPAQGQLDHCHAAVLLELSNAAASTDVEPRSAR